MSDLSEAELLLIRARASTTTVPMNGIGITFFTDHEERHIITQDLNGCTGIIIMSSYACLLAHIWPRPPFDPSPGAGDVNVLHRMQEMRNIFDQYRLYFADGTGVIAAALFNHEHALPSQIAIVLQVLEQLGLTYHVANYKVLNTGEARGLLKGTIVVRGRHGQTTQAFVEGHLLGIG